MSVVSKIYLSLIMATVYGIRLYAQSASYTVNINSDDFEYIVRNDTTYIKSKNYISYYPKINGSPIFPFITLQYIIPSNANITKTDINLHSYHSLGTHNIRSYSTTSNSIVDNNIENSNHFYVTQDHYPKIKNTNTTITKVDGYRIATLQVCPFTYNNRKQLSIADSISITFHFSEDTSSVCPNKGNNMRKSIEHSILNPSELNALYTSSYNNSTNDCNYLIITADSLKDTYKPLIKWKSLKGLRTSLITLEDIYTRYEGNNFQEKIKHCILDFYETKNMKYVILGGDTTIVPIRKCTTKVGSRVYSVPTDSYYACLDAPFNWDSNNNGLYGEEADSVDYGQDIFIARIPLDNNYDISTYIGKLIKFEKTGLGENEGLYNNIFFCGHGKAPHIATDDSRLKSFYMYEHDIAPYYNANFDYLFEDYTNLDFDYNSVQFNSYYFTHALQNGYNLVYVDSDGAEDKYGHHNFYYTVTKNSIDTLTCKATSFIIATADYSNNLSKNSMGAAFLKNKNLESVGYYGNSSISWDLDDFVINYTRVYPELLFREIFINRNRIFGKAIASSKIQTLGLVSSDSIYKHAILSFNASGDPNVEMLMEVPQRIVDVNAYNSDNYFKMDTNTDNCMLSSFYFQNDSICQHTIDTALERSCININEPINACLTKNGYLPFVYGENFVEDLFVQNKKYNYICTEKAKRINIGHTITEQLSTGNVILENDASLTLEYIDSVVLTSGFKCEQGAKFKIKKGKEQ